ncbi:MAG: hypothetical protein AB7D46_05720 [Flavobacteriaceae bacterium]
MEVINSFFNNVKDKLTNPYFGTLILVLLFHHWELLYIIFNFDDNVTLDIKLNSIKEYISINISFQNLMWDALWALILMLTGYLIIVITRSIVLWVEFWLMPFITGKIINKNVVKKDEYDKVVKEREEYFDQYEEQRKNVRNFSKTIDEQTEQIKQKDKDLLKQTRTISETIKELDLTKSKLEKSSNEAINKSKELEIAKNSISELKRDLEFKNDKLNKFEHLFFDKENQSFYSSIENFPPEVINKINELKKDNKLMAFIQLGSFYENGGTIGGELLTEMIKRELAFERGSREDLTPLGKIIYRYRKVLVNNE